MLHDGSSQRNVAAAFGVSQSALVSQYGIASTPLVDMADALIKAGHAVQPCTRQDRNIGQMALRRHHETVRALQIDFRRRPVCVLVTKLSVTDCMRKTFEADVQYLDQFLQGKHRTAQLEFVRNLQDWQLRHGRPVLFTNFHVSTCDRRVMVWRRPEESVTSREYDRYGGGSVMVWGSKLNLFLWMDVRTCKSLEGATTVRYRDEDLQPIVRPFAGAVGPNFLPMQDNAQACHSVVTAHLGGEGIDVMDWPARSPDLKTTRKTAEAAGQRKSPPATKLPFVTFRLKG